MEKMMMMMTCVFVCVRVLVCARACICLHEHVRVHAVCLRMCLWCLCVRIISCVHACEYVCWWCVYVYCVCICMCLWCVCSIVGLGVYVAPPEADESDRLHGRSPDWCHHFRGAVGQVGDLWPLTPDPFTSNSSLLTSHHWPLGSNLSPLTFHPLSGFKFKFKVFYCQMHRTTKGQTGHWNS